MSEDKLVELQKDIDSIKRELSIYKSKLDEIYEDYSVVEIYEIAKKQRFVMWLILFYYLAYIIASFQPMLAILFFIAYILQIFTIYQLAKKVRSSAVGWHVICSFILIGNTISLLILNHKASTILKKRGVKIGLLGAKGIKKLECSAETYIVDESNKSKAERTNISQNDF